MMTQNTYHVERLDGNGEVWVFLGVLDDGGRQHVSGALDVDARFVDGGELNALQVTHAPEQNLSGERSRPALFFEKPPTDHNEPVCRVELHAENLALLQRIEASQKQTRFSPRSGTCSGWV